ncbi:serine-rich adhesin for platelets [Drosophila willistoni]|uniref:serine-rich adhesin for platelets n=1 Tax=Drosophila willistoni TaxID=7260 RepID=UPI001F078F32|nr:serine-rich adhesin for platelets [Drosophila willistoni]
MLQPRLARREGREDCNICVSEPRTSVHQCPCHDSRKTMALALIVVLAVIGAPLGATQTAGDSFIVRPTPALRPAVADELTTVLLVNNGNGAGRVGDIHGRFLTVRPEVGLLTSTARTFIQEGTTTEFATQVLGTTLENGRLYAQYLKKSSRVLYENANSNIHVAPSVVTSWVGDSTNLHTRAFLQSHNDLLNADAPDWQDIDDRLGGSSTSRSHDKFVGNTDFVSFQSASPTIGLEAASSTNSDHESPSKNVPIVNVFPDRFGNLENNARKLAAQKVLPIGDLPTFTIKTHFEPSAYQLDDDNSMSQEEQRQHASYLGLDDGRSPKVFYQHLMEGQNHDNVKMPAEQSLSKETVLPKRTLATVTYYGFADFTTLVGDSVIVFSPNTLETSPNFGHVTSIKGKATLSTLESRSGSNIAPQSSITIGMQKAEIVSTQINPWAIGLDVNTSEIPNNPPSAVQSMTPELKMSQGSIISTASGSSIGNIITTEQVAPKKTELSETNPTFSLPTDQEISEIYASLAKAQDKAATPSSISEASSEIVFDTKTLKAKSSVQVLGGATTVFIDDDPFANFVESIAPSTSTSSVLLSTSAPSTLINYESATEEAVTLGPEPLDISTLPPPGSTDEEETTIPSVTEDLTGIIDSQKLQETFGGKIENCKNTTSQVFLTQVPKSGVIEDLSTQFQNDASLLAAFDIVQTTKYYCIDTTVMHVEPQQVEKPENDIIMATSSLYIPITTDSTPSTEAQDVDETTTEDSSSLLETHTEPNLVEMPVKEGPTVPKLDEASSSENDSDERETEKDSEDYDADTESDEVDLIYKTLYTTYTYLTTFFQAESSTVSSHTEIVTNVITSTVGTSEDVDVKPTAIVAQIGDNEITATQTLQGDSSAKTSTITTKYTIPEELESLLHVDSQSANRNSNTETISHSEATVYLDDAKYTKTFFTTYTYYTTIFADSDTEIMSRTEVLTNYVTESAGKTSLSASILNSDLVDGQKVVPSPISTLATASSDELHNISKVDEERVTLVTDVRSSSSNGEQQVIGKGLRDPFDDQVSSESNTDEIIPSATLLLQTSFTTFTFYTTMYSGDITNVVSRLETVTNVATETLQPTKTLAGSVDEATLPITYFTTFTYWTKLAKDGEITTLSREETISNVIGPTQEASSSTYDYAPIMTITDSAENHFAITPETSGETNATVKSLPDLTTYYTTYTYYTTSYEANNTVTDSRFETVTNVVTPTSTVATSLPALDELDAKKDLSQTVTKIHGLGEINTPDLVLYDYKHIVDADGVSTLYFTTQIVSSVNIEGAAIAVTSSTSSLYIDEAKKLSISTLSASEATDENGSVSRQYKTGLVRLIEGTRIGNSTTTLYQSKVIGTLIDDRYAQIIESTSSFLFEKTVGPTEIVATPTLGPIISTQEFTDAASISESGDSTISDTETTTESNTDGNDDTEIQDTLQSKKRTFAPVIRPFASRNRPTFAPKQKIITPSSATIITRSDITPTITATPALKTIGRYSSSKRGPISNAPINPNDSSTSRRSFGRPIKPSSSSALSEVSNSSVFAPSRNRFASSSRSGPLLSSRRLGASASYRPSNGPGFRASALNTLNSKLRIKPTAALSSSLGQSTTNTVAPANPDSSSESEHSTETPQTTDEDETLLENSRRNQNPLLRFRRPLNRPSGFTPIPRPNAGTSNSPTISPRRNPLSGRAKTSATTTTTTTTTVKPRPRSFQRPTISSLQGRSRPQNNLFPPRGLFQAQQQKTEAPPEVKQAEAEAENDSEYDDDDDADDDGDEDGQDETNRRRRSNNKLARPKTHLRVRRQADGLNRSRFRFRRPSTASPPVADEQTIANTDDLSESTVNPRAKARFGSRYQAARGQGQSQHLHGQTTAPSPTTTTNLRSIRPTRPISSRTQFTLREKDNSSKGSIRPGSNFRRQQPSVSSSIRRKTGSSTVGSTSRRLKSYNSNSGNNNVESSGSRSAASRGRNGNTNASSRSRVRSRNRNEYISDQEPTELGTQTITVTHLIPAEVTVPVINGQVTEYKNIVTAKTSTEVLGPHQYSQIVGTNGQTSVFLTREDSSVNIAGATELTRYLLHDSLTTTITFTPTTIRGRKTSFSHVLPSTVYSVEALISTVQPQISANAPLANILLSQLLLGNLNLPSNPLIGALGQQLPDTMPAVSPTPLQPVTEFRTHTSTFVTTIFDGKSTIVPVTFQGKKILTTVYDSSWQTITATEYSVDTIVNTPTQQQPQHAQSIGQVAQVNSLLLQQLLLQQQQPQQPQLQTISHTTSPQIFLSDNLQDLDEASRSGVEIGGRDSIDDIIVPVENENDGEVQHKGNRKKTRKSSKGHKRNKQQLNLPQDESSVVTLYVSGRRPGEFSTILSTVQNGYDHSVSLQKRQAHANIKTTVAFDGLDDQYESEGSETVQLYVPLKIEADTESESDHLHLQLVENSLASDVRMAIMHEPTVQTASLESIVGDVGLWYAKSTSQASLAASSTTTDSSKGTDATNTLHFLA